MKSFKILIIGGTRFFGIDIVNFLLEKNHQVSILSDSPQKDIFIKAVEIYKGDRHDKSLLRKIARENDFDFIIDNIASGREDIKECLSAFKGRVNRYILTSSCWVYKVLAPISRPFEEGDLKDVFYKRKIDKITRDYIKGKISAEQVLLNQQDVKYTIFRPCMISGPNDHNLRSYFYFQKLKEGKEIIALKEQKRFQLAFKEDIARVYERAVATEKSANQIYNLAPLKTITAVDFIKMAAKSLNTKPAICFLEKEQALDYFKEEPFNFESDLYSSTKAVKELKISFTPYEKWIKKTMLWHLKKYA